MIPFFPLISQKSLLNPMLRLSTKLISSNITWMLKILISYGWPSSCCQRQTNLWCSCCRFLFFIYFLPHHSFISGKTSHRSYWSWRNSSPPHWTRHCYENNLQYKWQMLTTRQYLSYLNPILFWQIKLIPNTLRLYPWSRWFSHRLIFQWWPRKQTLKEKDQLLIQYWFSLNCSEVQMRWGKGGWFCVRVHSRDPGSLFKGVDANDETTVCSYIYIQCSILSHIFAWSSHQCALYSNCYSNSLLVPYSYFYSRAFLPFRLYFSVLFSSLLFSKTSLLTIVSVLSRIALPTLTCLTLQWYFRKRLDCNPP